MEKSDIQSLISLTIEVEGLLRVHAERPDDADVLCILRSKVGSLADALALEDEPVAPIAPIENLDPIDSIDAIENIDPIDSIDAIENLDPIDSFENFDIIDETETRPPFTPASTLNDKFRYVRELFDGSIKDYEDAIARVQGMHSLAEAYDYFLDELGWDADEEAAGEYLMCVANYFNPLA